MSTIHNSLLSNKENTSEVFSEQELELELEPIESGEPTEESQDQDQNDQGSGGSDQGDGNGDVGTGGIEGVEQANEQETIPSTFFSAMAYSIEAYLEAIEAQQESALMNIELYSQQVEQQQKTTGVLADNVRERLMNEAKKMFAEAIVTGISAGISAGQAGYGFKKSMEINPKLSKASLERDNLQWNMDNRKNPASIHGNPPPRGGARSNSGTDPVGDALTDAKLDYKSHSTDPDLPSDYRHGLDPRETMEYDRGMRDAIHAADHKIAGYHSELQTAMTKFQVYAEIGKSAAQALGSTYKGFVEQWNAELDWSKTHLENVKELLSSVIQQIQGRISSTSRGALDGVESLRNAIRQFQG